MIRKLAVASLLSLACAPVFAADCAIEIESTDQMTWNTSAIEVSKSCKEFKVTLKHVGQLPKEVMGHNWVLTKAADSQAVSTEGMGQGPDKGYLDESDERVLAHTKLIGGGESDTATLDVSKLAAGEDYTFFCSFPGHVALMRGSLKLVD